MQKRVRSSEAPDQVGEKPWRCPHTGQLPEQVSAEAPATQCIAATHTARTGSSPVSYGLIPFAQGWKLLKQAKL